MPYKLLLADDSVTIQRVIDLTFADEDIQVIAVGDGDQAIARIDRDPPDIVLADVGRPGRDGYEVAAHVKQSPRLAHIPVILLTGAFEPVDEVRAKSIGCDGVLAKPFEPQIVIARVRELLAGSTGPVATAGAGAGVAPVAEAKAPSGPPPETADPGRDASDVAALDEYFDRLDAALTLSSGSAQRQTSVGPPPPSIPDPIDWFAPESAAPVPDLALSYEPSQADVEPPVAPSPAPRLVPVEPLARAATPAVVPTPVAAPTPSAAPTPAPVPTLAAVPAFASEAARRPTLPPLADAFAALLAAEQATPAAAPAWPASTPPSTLVTDDLIEQVTRRTLERLSDRVVRETVSDIVSAVAERLVREEIERIKATIK